MTAVADDIRRHRLALPAEDGIEATLVYGHSGDRLYLIHTGVPSVLRGRGTGERLVTAAVDLARRGGLTIVPWCPFARRWLLEHPKGHAGVTIDWSVRPTRGLHD